MVLRGCSTNFVPFTAPSINNEYLDIRYNLYMVTITTVAFVNQMNHKINTRIQNEGIRSQKCGKIKSAIIILQPNTDDYKLKF